VRSDRDSGVPWCKPAAEALDVLQVLVGVMRNLYTRAGEQQIYVAVAVTLIV
jgi:hypothetical protein